MNIEAITGDGSTHRFSSRDKSYCSTGDHKVDLPLPEDTYVITIDTSSNSLGFTISSTTTQSIYFAGNFIKEYKTQSSYDFTSEFITCLEHFFKTIKYIRYVKIEKPYNSRDRRFAQSYAVLKSVFDSIAGLSEKYGAIFIPTQPSSWMNTFLGTEKENLEYSSNKANIKSKVRSLYPVIQLPTQDVYDAVGMKEVFFIKDIAPNCFLAMNTSTKINKRLGKEVHYKFFKNNVKLEDMVNDLIPKRHLDILTIDYQQFSFSGDFELIENFNTAFYYKPDSIILFRLTVDIKVLPFLYKSDLKNIKENEEIILVAHCLGGDRGNVVEI